MRLRSDGIPAHVAAARRFLDVVRGQDGATARADQQTKVTQDWVAKINWVAGPIELKTETIESIHEFCGCPMRRGNQQFSTGAKIMRSEYNPIKGKNGTRGRRFATALLAGT